MTILIDGTSGDGLTFLELQDEALGDDFAASKYRVRVKRWLNEALAKIRRGVDVEDAEVVEQIALVAGVPEYTLPSQRARIGSVHRSDPWTELVQVGWDDIDPDNVSSGTPDRFATLGETLMVYPTPDTDGVLTVRLWERADQMDDDGDFPAVPADYQDLLVTYARSRLYRAEEDLEMARALMDEFRGGLGEAKGELQFASKARRRQVPGMWQRSTGPSFVRPS